MPEHLPPFDAITAALNLGALAAPPECIKPGAVSAWRLTTARGSFHVKVFPAAVWHDNAGLFLPAAEVEQAAGGAAIPMPEPIAINQPVGDAVVTVHRWVDARALAPGDDIGAWLGGTMARLHTLPPPPSAPADPFTRYYGAYPPETWRRWVASGLEHRLAWAGPARDALDTILAARAIVAEGLALGLPVAGSHRDLHGLNVLMQSDGEPILVDWDLAGPEVAWFEATRAAVEFGRLAATGPTGKPNDPDPTVARAIIHAYLDAGGTSGPGGPLALSGTLGMALNRIAFHIQVSLGERHLSPAEHDTAAPYIIQALPKLAARMATAEAVTAGLEP